jgi:predicted dehydrogenase
VQNPVAPQIGHELRLENGEGELREQVDRTPSYVYQLEAFLAAVQDGAPVPTDGADAVATLTVIDALYAAAGLRPRGDG